MSNHAITQEIKQTLSLSLPLMAAWVIYALGPFAGTAMVARLSNDALAASILVATIWIAGITFCFGLLHAVSIFCAQQFGAKNFTAVGNTLVQGYYLSIFCMVPLGILIYCIPYFVHASAHTPAILENVRAFSHSLLFAIPGLLLLVMVEHFLSGIGKTKITFWVSLIEIPIEIFLIYCFVFGKFGFPASGIAGVGYGLGLCFTLTALVLFTWLHHATFMQPFPMFKNLKNFNWHDCKSMFQVGAPVGFTYFIELIAFTIATYFIASFSTTALAAHQIIMQFLGVFINIPYAIAQATSIRVGHNVGRQDRAGVIYAAWAGLIIGIVTAIIIAMLCIFAPKLFIAIDIDIHNPANAALINMTCLLFALSGIYNLIDSIRILNAGILRGLKETKFTMLVNIFCFFFFGTSCAYLFGYHFHGNIYGVWLGLTAGMLLGSSILSWRVVRETKVMDLAAILHKHDEA